MDICRPVSTGVFLVYGGRLRSGAPSTRSIIPVNRIKLPAEHSRSHELYNYLRRAILSGDLRPGERLVENRLATLAAVSRTPVREALHRLEVDGLVRPSDGGGVEVCSFSLEELADLCAVREALEGLASRLAATSRSEFELVQLQAIVAEELNTLDDEGNTELQVALNHHFHETLWRASRNRYLMGELDRLRGTIESLQATTLNRSARQHEAVSEHRKMLAAIELRDGDEAERRAREHFRNAMASRLVRSVPDSMVNTHS